MAHLYYLPKAHKPGTPLRSIISGLKYPTIKVSKFLDNLLQPFFNQIAIQTTVTSGFELIKLLQQWPLNRFKQETLLGTIDVVDLYIMIPQVEGVLALRKIVRPSQNQTSRPLESRNHHQISQICYGQQLFQIQQSISSSNKRRGDGFSAHSHYC